MVNDELAWVDENGRFDVFGLELGNSYSLNVFGNSIANRSGKLSDYEEKLATVIYAPDPVPIARICEEMEIRSREGDRDEWSCRERDYNRYPADVGKLWFYTRIQAVPPTEVVHRWRYGNEAVDVTPENWIPRLSDKEFPANRREDRAVDS